MKTRLDDLLVKKEISSSKNKAAQLIKSGGILINGEKVIKPGKLLNHDVKIQVTKQQKYVGRGALKLAAAIKEFEIPVKNKIAADIGACTGGFTDFLLQNGVKKVYAIDVGHDQLAEKLKNDCRVINMEGVNIRNPINQITNKSNTSKIPSDKASDDFPQNVDLAVADLSHISLKLVIDNIFNLVKQGGDIILLIKPQFEAGPGIVDKQGIIRNDSTRKKILKDFLDWCKLNEFNLKKYIQSPIQGKNGNIEYLAWFNK